MEDKRDTQIALRVGTCLFTNYSFDTPTGKLYLPHAKLSKEAAARGYIPSQAEIQDIIDRNMPRQNDSRYDII
jgi:hypothetical protein